MADLVEPAGKLGPGRHGRFGRYGVRARRLVSRQQRVDREDMLDVHQDQFLMLLLVMCPELDQRRGPLPDRLAGGFDESQHRRGNMVAIGGDGIDGRSRQKAALRARMARPDRFVIGVEQIGEGGVEFAVSRVEGTEQEGLEEPAGVRQMPFRRADIRHRLDRLILGRQVTSEGFALLAHRGEAVALGAAVGTARR